MACCLAVPNHYLKQYWLINNEDIVALKCHGKCWRHWFMKLISKCTCKIKNNLQTNVLIIEQKTAHPLILDNLMPLSITTRLYHQNGTSCIPYIKCQILWSYQISRKGVPCQKAIISKWVDLKVIWAMVLFICNISGFRNGRKHIKDRPYSQLVFQLWPRKCYWAIYKPQKQHMYYFIF